MSTALSKKTRVEKLSLKERYSYLERLCLAAINNLYRGHRNVFSFAIFAKSIPWWEIPLSRTFRRMILREEGVDKVTYKKWEEAYCALPQEVRKQTEAVLLF